MLTYLQERGLLKGRGKQRTDSTHILAAIRTLNRLELVGEIMRFALNRLAAVVPAWLRTHLQPAWLERYGARAENSRLPRTEAARQRLAATIGADGFALLETVYAPETPSEVRTEPAVTHFLTKAIRRHGMPEKVTVDGSEANAAAEGPAETPVVAVAACRMPEKETAFCRFTRPPP
jgi:hypothetical protein